MSTHEWLPHAFAGRSFTWYLLRVIAELDRLFERHRSVSVVAHSQGGVLALILLGSHLYDGEQSNDLLEKVVPAVSWTLADLYHSHNLCKRPALVLLLHGLLKLSRGYFAANALF